MKRKRLLVSVRGPAEAVQVALGGGHIADVEYPASALGTPYPLNIHRVRSTLLKRGFKSVRISTNIGEIQTVRASACQSALGVALAGADYVKFGLAEQTLQSATYLGQSLVRTVRKFFGKKKRLFPAVFVDDDMMRFFDAFSQSHKLVESINADGLLLDTFNKQIGKSLLDYCSLREISSVAKKLHAIQRQLWVAGSLSRNDMSTMWRAGVDVICVRGAACVPTGAGGRFGEVRADVVSELMETIPRRL